MKYKIFLGICIFTFATITVHLGYTYGHSSGYASGYTDGHSSGYASGYTDGERQSALVASDFYLWSAQQPVISMGEYSVLNQARFEVLQVGDTPTINISENSTNCMLIDNLFQIYQLKPDDILIFKYINDNGVYYGLQLIQGRQE